MPPKVALSLLEARFVAIAIAVAQPALPCSAQRPIVALKAQRGGECNQKQERQRWLESALRLFKGARGY